MRSEKVRQAAPAAALGAYAPKDALEGTFLNTSRDAFRVAHDVSAYSWSR